MVCVNKVLKLFIFPLNIFYGTGSSEDLIKFFILEIQSVGGGGTVTY